MSTGECILFEYKSNSVVLLLTTDVLVSKETRYITGYPLKFDGEGCKDVNHTLASPNSKDML